MMMPNDNTLTDGHDSMVMVLMLYVINKTTTGNKWFSTYYQKIMSKKPIYLYKITTVQQSMYLYFIGNSSRNIRPAQPLKRGW